jgi:hypothetical protein
MLRIFPAVSLMALAQRRQEIAGVVNPIQDPGLHRP